MFWMAAGTMVERGRYCDMASEILGINQLWAYLVGATCTGHRLRLLELSYVRLLLQEKSEPHR